METIGFDIDGVLYPWQRVAYSWLRANRGITTPYLQFWNGSMEDIFPPGTRKFLIGIESLYGSAVPDRGVVETLDLLSKDYNICYITSRPKSMTLVTEEWFDKYKLPCAYNLVVGVPKTIAVRLFNCKYYVEDRIKYIEELKNITNIIVMRQPWNFDYWDSLAVDYVDEIPKLLEELK
jgi:hypothetical protein